MTMGAHMIIYKARLACLNDCLIWNIFKIFLLYFVWKFKKPKFDPKQSCNILLCKYMFKIPLSRYVMLKKNSKNKNT